MAVIAPERVDFSFPIVKSAKDRSGALRVYGCATSDRLDRDGERIDPVASRRWLEAWLSTGGNLRLQHDARRPIGKGLELHFRPEGHFLTSVVVDAAAKELVAAGVLTGYSVGVVKPGFTVDRTGKAARVITDNPDGTTELAEVSLVDRPSNPDCADVMILRKVAKQVDLLIVKAAGKRGKAARRAAREASVMVTRAAGAADAARVQAMARSAGTELSGWQLAEVTAGIRADLYSCDPAARETAHQILGADRVNKSAERLVGDIMASLRASMGITKAAGQPAELALVESVLTPLCDTFFDHIDHVDKVLRAIYRDPELGSSRLVEMDANQWSAVLSPDVPPHRMNGFSNGRQRGHEQE